MFRYTLVADGRSDKALLPILDWLIQQHSDHPYESQFAQPLPPVGHGLAARVATALHLFPCELLFVHRDAEGASLEDREAEINGAVLTTNGQRVPVVPVRMTEAWLLSSESAIRTAADNPSGTTALQLPASRKWDKIPDPKAVLREALRKASELGARRLRKFDADGRRFRVAELTDDFSTLRCLRAFQRLETTLKTALAHLGFARSH